MNDALPYASQREVVNEGIDLTPVVRLFETIADSKSVMQDVDQVDPLNRPLSHNIY